MPTNHTVAFHDDGVVEHTRSTALDKVFGTSGDMQRVTDIFRGSDGQYYIKWMLGPFAGSVQDMEHAAGLGVIVFAEDTHFFDLIEYPLPFNTYEAAVAHEVEMLAAMRKDGVRFDGN
jgi:hypothetical protein